MKFANRLLTRILVISLIMVVSTIANAGQFSSSLVPTGLVQMYAGSTAPVGWLICDGTAVNIASYPRLYNVLGTGYNRGGEATGTFRIPDFRGIFPIGVGTSGVYGANYVGTRGGYAQDSTYTSLAYNLAHSHDISINGDSDAGAYYSFVNHIGDGGGAPGFWEMGVTNWAWGGGPAFMSPTLGKRWKATSKDTTGLSATLTHRSSTTTKPACVGVNFIIRY